MTLHRPLAAVIAASVLTLAGCTGSHAVDQTAGAGTRNAALTSNARLIPPGDRTTVTGVAGTTLDGQHLALSDLRGHVVVVNFWGSWCADCVAEIDGLTQVAKQYHDQGVRFVGVDIKETGKAQARTFARTHGVTYPNLWDPGVSLAVHFTPPPVATPTTYVLDRSGKIAAVVNGTAVYTTLNTLVRDVVGGTA